MSKLLVAVIGILIVLGILTLFSVAMPSKRKGKTNKQRREARRWGWLGVVLDIILSFLPF
ncbi:MAG: hypothetical protein ACYCVB_05925 [Bacilli bacterium]